MSNLRQHNVVFSFYTLDFKGFWPALVDPPSGLSNPGATTEPYFLPTSAWPRWLGQDYYGDAPGGTETRIFAHPRVLDAGIVTGYMYAATHYTRPEYWDPYTRSDTRREWRGVRADEVFFPSAKAIFAEIRPAERGLAIPTTALAPDARFALGLSDGSVRAVRPGQLTKPFRTGTGTFHRDDLMPGIGIYGLHTPDGVYGMDVTPGGGGSSPEPE